MTCNKRDTICDKCGGSEWEFDGVETFCKKCGKCIGYVKDSLHSKDKEVEK